jgi:hypothetical protein
VRPSPIGVALLERDASNRRTRPFGSGLFPILLDADEPNSAASVQAFVECLSTPRVWGLEEVRA